MVNSVAISSPSVVFARLLTKAAISVTFTLYRVVYRKMREVVN